MQSKKQSLIESRHQHDFSTCKCGMSSCDGGDSYIRPIGDLNMIEYMSKRIDVWEDGDKIRCIDGSKQKTLELGKVYTVDTSINTTNQHTIS